MNLLVRPHWGESSPGHFHRKHRKEPPLQQSFRLQIPDKARHTSPWRADHRRHFVGEATPASTKKWKKISPFLSLYLMGPSGKGTWHQGPGILQDIAKNRKEVGNEKQAVAAAAKMAVWIYWTLTTRQVLCSVLSVHCPVLSFPLPLLAGMI